MRYIKGVVFSNTLAGNYSAETAKLSLVDMKKQSACNTVVFVISAIQDNAESNMIDFQHQYMPKDNDLLEIIGFAKEIGLQTILKPEIICMNGESQAEVAKCHQNENEESLWFNEYQNYIMHYANIAQQSQSDMFIIGCELVELEKKEIYWRNLICKIRTEYDGFLTYNADRCQEDNVIWWDALDYISASGFYRNNELPNQIKRLDKIQKKYNKPFFFSEVGCKSCEGGSKEPGDWKFQGKLDLGEQSQYFDEFFHACDDTDAIGGMVVYDWWQNPNSTIDNAYDSGYNISGKPVCDVIRKRWAE